MGQRILVAVSGKREVAVRDGGYNGCCLARVDLVGSIKQLFTVEDGQSVNRCRMALHVPNSQYSKANPKALETT